MSSNTPLRVSPCTRARNDNSIRSCASWARSAPDGRRGASSSSPSTASPCGTSGSTEEKIRSIPNWAVASCYDETERLVLAYTDCLVYEHGRVPDALFDALQEHLSDVEILELTYITSLYFQHAVMSRALRTEFDDRDDPVVEVPGPEGASALHPGPMNPPPGPGTP